MSKFFRTSPPATRSAPQRLLSRLLLFGAGLVLLWTSVQLMPGPSEAAVQQRVYSDRSGTVAAAPHTDRSRGASAGRFTPGYLVALALLAGGAGLALYLRHRPGTAAPGERLHLLGTMQLAPSQQLRLVACGEDVLLLGVTSAQITLLKCYDRTAFGAALHRPNQTPAPPAAAPGTAFAAFLQNCVGPAAPPEPTTTPC